MKTFEEFPEGSKCPVCDTNDNKECVLIPIIDKAEGNISEALLFHIECIDLLYNNKLKILYQVVKKKDGIKKDIRMDTTN